MRHWHCKIVKLMSEVNEIMNSRNSTPSALFFRFLIRAMNQIDTREIYIYSGLRTRTSRNKQVGRNIISTSSMTLSLSADYHDDKHTRLVLSRHASLSIVQLRKMYVALLYIRNSERQTLLHFLITLSRLVSECQPLLEVAEKASSARRQVDVMDLPFEKKSCIEALNTQSSVVNVWEHGIPRRSTDWWIKKKCWKYPQKWAKQQFFTSKESTAAARGFLFSRVRKNFCVWIMNSNEEGWTLLWGGLITATMSHNGANVRSSLARLQFMAGSSSFLVRINKPLFFCFSLSTSSYISVFWRSIAVEKFLFGFFLCVDWSSSYLSRKELYLLRLLDW